MSVTDIERVLLNTETLIVPDEKNSKIEPRFIAIGRATNGRYALVVFTPRNREDQAVLRPISARYMHKKEIEKYAQEISRAQD